LLALFGDQIDVRAVPERDPQLVTDVGEPGGG
jgi:hypothetical protein